MWFDQAVRGSYSEYDTIGGEILGGLMRINLWFNFFAAGRDFQHGYYNLDGDEMVSALLGVIPTFKAISLSGALPKLKDLKKLFKKDSSKKAGGKDAVENVPERPSWRQSEIDAEMDYKEYDSQKPFLNGEEVPYGTKGSSRPELYKPGHSIEVKNYNIQTSSGQNNLINNVSKQIKERVTNLPDGTDQTILIDVRGQNVTNDILKDIRSKILEKSDVSDVNVEIIFKR